MPPPEKKPYLPPVKTPNKPPLDGSKSLRDALALVDIRVLDHLIVAGDVVTSLAERGVL